MMQQYELSPKPIGTGSFGVVWQATHAQSKRVFALKVMKKPYQSMEEANQLAEVRVMRLLGSHPHILKLHEVVYDRSSQLVGLVMDLMESNLYELMCSYKRRRQYIPQTTVCHYLYAALKGIAYFHSHNVFHRDLKPENILVDSEGGLKVADMGSVKGIFKPGPFTEYTGTRWYRAPEVLLTNGLYGAKMDMWALGCVFFELMALDPAFPGESETSTLNLIHCVLGTPSKEALDAIPGSAQGQFVGVDFPFREGRSFKEMLQHFGPSDEAIDLLEKLLVYNPKKRLSAKQALKHPYFAEIRSIDRKLIAEAKSDTMSSTKSSTNKTPTETDTSRSVATDTKSSSLPSIPSIDSQGTLTNSDGQLTLSPTPRDSVHLPLLKPMPKRDSISQVEKLISENTTLATIPLSSTTSNASSNQRHIDPSEAGSLDSGSLRSAAGSNKKKAADVPIGLPPLVPLKGKVPLPATKDDEMAQLVPVQEEVLDSRGPFQIVASPLPEVPKLPRIVGKKTQKSPAPSPVVVTPLRGKKPTSYIPLVVKHKVEQQDTSPLPEVVKKKAEPKVASPAPSVSMREVSKKLPNIHPKKVGTQCRPTLAPGSPHPGLSQNDRGPAEKGHLASGQLPSLVL